METEHENQLGLEDEGGQAEGIGLPGETPLAVDREAMPQLVRKRLEKFVSLVATVMAGDDPETVHDARVWSRRLQQSLTALSPKPMPGKARRQRRTLRRVRRALGEWRDCDVVVQLVTRERRRTRSRAKRHAWELVLEYVREKRIRQVLRARQKLLKHDRADFAGRVHKLLDRRAGDEGAQPLAASLRASVENAWVQRQSALAHAEESREAGDIHMFRIAIKRLRYRVELVHDLGDRNTQPLLDWLKELQEALGIWHDHQTLHQAIAEALARPDFLLRKADTARTLLAELEKGRSRQSARVDEIFRLARQYTDASGWDKVSEDR